MHERSCYLLSGEMSRDRPAPVELNAPAHVRAASERSASAGVAGLDGRLERGRRTRSSILAAAVNVASVEGLEGLTIGRLASALGMSKSGLFAHFGSKEELQLATIGEARQMFVAAVVEPARAAERGLPRLRAVLEAWCRYMRGEVFAGGCFFDGARAEYDSRPPGPVRDAIAAQMRDWSAFLVDLVRSAQRAGDIDPEADPDQVAFELDAFGEAANVTYQLHRDPAVFQRARRAIDDRLNALERAAA
jgi:AcrR family transcriptional regulator